jgi:hypothetical protein
MIVLLMIIDQACGRERERERERKRERRSRSSKLRSQVDA